TARSRRCKPDLAFTEVAAGLRLTRGADRDILLALPLIGHGIGDARHRQPALPQLPPRSRVEGAQISIPRAGKGETAGGDRDAIDERRAERKGDAERRAVLGGAHARAPENLAGLKIERDHL